MKTFVLIVVLLFSNIALSQKNYTDSLQSDTLELFYILDSRWSPPNTDAQETDNRPNYSQVS